MSETKYVASVSFGKDSLAMLLLLLEEGQPLDEVAVSYTHLTLPTILLV